MEEHMLHVVRQNISYVQSGHIGLCVAWYERESKYVSLDLIALKDWF
jgi:hypothetical protein